MTSSVVKTSDTDVDKLVIVRVKRKQCHSPLDAFWLEINERPWKRQILNFENLSIADHSDHLVCKEEIGAKKVLVKHIETVAGTKDVIDVVQELIVPKPNDPVEGTTKFEERRRMYKRKTQQSLSSTKSRTNRETFSRNIRFEQIWRSRKGSNGSSSSAAVHDVCHFYDVIRVDDGDGDGDGDGATKGFEKMPIEERNRLARFLPLLKDFVPTAAAEIESDLRHSSGPDEYVYDYYVLNEDSDFSEDDSSFLPLVKVEDDYSYDDEDCLSVSDSDDSNAEDHPRNEYPDESEDADSGDEDDDVETSENSEWSSDDAEISDYQRYSAELSDGDRFAPNEDAGSSQELSSDGFDYFGGECYDDLG